MESIASVRIFQFLLRWIS